VTYQPDRKHFRSVTNPQVYETQHRSAQLPLWTFGDDEWPKVMRVPPMKVRKKRPLLAVNQPALF
jgi:hypothetical protein